VNGMTKVRLSFLSLGFGVALLFAPSARAQESCPDHFTETGVELGCPGRNVAQPAAQATQAKQTKSAAASADRQNHPIAKARLVLVADKNRQASTPAPKR